MEASFPFHERDPKAAPNLIQDTDACRGPLCAFAHLAPLSGFDASILLSWGLIVALLGAAVGTNGSPLCVKTSVVRGPCRGPVDSVVTGGAWQGGGVVSGALS